MPSAAGQHVGGLPPRRRATSSASRSTTIAQLSQSLQIRPDGKITLPLVGDVAAAGRTSIELRDAIASSLKDYITNPVVTVIVVETTPQVVYVTGEVNKPGALPLIERPAVDAPGAGDGRRLHRLRQQEGHPHPAQGAQPAWRRCKFNYKDALDDDNKREPLQLLPGDTVIVK